MTTNVDNDDGAAHSRRRSRGVARLVDRFLDRMARLSPAAWNLRRSQPIDLLAWSQRHLGAHFRRSPSAMHRWLADELDRMTHRRGARVNLLAPRGSAKSTVGSLAYVLRSAVEGTEPYIWIVSATKDQAWTHLANVKGELVENALLARAYPKSAGRGRHWRNSRIELASGAVVESFGVGQQLRGRRHGAARPTLIVCDDVENDQRVASAVHRADCREWFQGVVLKAGDERTNVVNLATALHRDALAMQLAQAPGWTSRTFKSIERWPDDMELWSAWEELACRRDDLLAADRARQFFDERREAMLAGAELLWPEKEDLYDLMRMRVEGGHAAFEREKQNSPIDPERCEWPAEYFDDHIWFGQWPRDLAVRVMALDPSKGADARLGDYSAYALAGIDGDGTIYVEADLGRRPTPRMVYDGVCLHNRFRPDAFGVEANQFQELLVGEFVEEFRRQHHGLATPMLIHNHVNKLVRIRRLGPYLAQRRLKFLSSSPSTRLLVDQLRDFPIGDHDDGPDALEMALRLAESLLFGAEADDGLGSRLIA